MMFYHQIQRPRARGFTLLELLVSITVSIGLFALLYSILNLALTRWRNDTSGYLNNVEAQVALDSLAEDLRSIVIKQDGSEWLQVQPILVENLGTLPWLMFLGRPMSDGSMDSSSPRAISYRLEKRDPFNSNEPFHALYRTVLSAEETIEKLGSKNLYEEIWRSRELDAVGTDQFLASHVVGLELLFQLRTPDGKPFTLKNGTGLRISTQIETIPPSAPIPPDSILESLQINLTVVDPVGQEMLSGGGTSLDEIVTRFGRTQSAFVTFSQPIQ
ncbi:MAG: prepilin-type N-terminal cleavage/methylation domain-containing protein [Verrucomicrobiae bacterium]|nr:prepilin-type N-terminal cleavage/methylation domain-containing protein [Verrucomicrobiae bacterium]